MFQQFQQLKFRTIAGSDGTRRAIRPDDVREIVGLDDKTCRVEFVQEGRAPIVASGTVDSLAAELNGLPQTRFGPVPRHEKPRVPIRHSVKVPAPKDQP